MILSWLDDPRLRLEPGEAQNAEYPPVEVETFSTVQHEVRGPDVIPPAMVPSVTTTEIVLAGGYRVKARETIDPDVLSWLLRGMMT